MSNFVRPSSAYNLADGTADAQAVAALSGLVLMGWSIRESAGTPAVASLIIRNGTTATDPIVAVIEFAANGGSTEWFGPGGIDCANGIYVDRVAGSTEGSILYARNS